MGCDIHLYLEKRNKLGKWENSEYTKNELRLWRSYPMFARMADVRNYWDFKKYHLVSVRKGVSPRRN